jgi:hypothetical protein
LTDTNAAIHGCSQWPGHVSHSRCRVSAYPASCFSLLRPTRDMFGPCVPTVPTSLAALLSSAALTCSTSNSRHGIIIHLHLWPWKNTGRRCSSASTRTRSAGKDKPRVHTTTGDIPHAAPEYQEGVRSGMPALQDSVGILQCWWSMPSSTG